METGKTIVTNRKAYHDYNIQESIEAGIALRGTEIKSIRTGRINLREAYARPEGGELWLVGAHIPQYSGGNRHNHEPRRPRKLLLHRKQIDRLTTTMMAKRLTLVPLRLYLKDNLAKVELGVAKGKKLYDKRRTIAEKDTKRDIERTMKVHSARGR